MNIKLTQKEKLLLEDQKSQEELCIKKYNDYANQVQDPQLKQMFQKIAQYEQQHLDTINQILNGQVPSMNNQQSGGQSGMQSGQSGQSGMQSGQNQPGQNIREIQSGSTPGTVGTTPRPVTATSGSNNQSDKDICQDLLMTEKYVSGTYDTTIFECVDANVRQVLNHIQKEEQEHGEEIFNYMQANGMYTPQ